MEMLLTFCKTHIPTCSDTFIVIISYFCQSSFLHKNQVNQ